MKVAVATDHLTVRTEEWPEPVPGPGELRVRIRVCGACTSDVLSWYVKKKAPVVLGHEPVAEVLEPGDGVDGFRPGQRLFVHHHAPCGSCRFCRREQYILCPTWRKQALSPGGFAEEAIVRSQAVRMDTLTLPDEVSDEAAALIEPFACSIHAFRQAGIRPDDRVILIGMGGMGFLNAYAARAYGVKEIAVTDLMPERLEMARDHGFGSVIDGNTPDAAEALREASGGEGGDIVIVGPGYLPAMELGMKVVAPGGTVVLFTPSAPEDVLGISPHHLYFNDITVTTSYSCDPNDTKESLRMIAGGALPVDRLITHRFPLDRVEDALKILSAGGRVLKVLVDVS
ncbi:MAG TPA: alcohol dehydrogenase catalytic domain-containing protein [Thermoanaerobaculia bacterium]|mgnify:CR=1 FL=1|nr:alcohol dehydrogenase catalytic domain-containing protein [Thermoanaerobaculia bacterium]HUM29700.1 alcohol dehydrogenase catalytic domain-containing protein [Thermoanaerobaculia bacterium]HXK67000.1 alcohol dehydrogenase catalytic domain-containing protein [Thermoanaerobaculia bacterium]